MKSARQTLPRVLVLLALLAPTVAACATGTSPGGPPSPTATGTAPTPSAIATTGPTTPTPNPAPTATATRPAPEWTVVSSRLAYSWRWPNADNPASVNHLASDPVLVSIGAANHPNDPATRPYNRMSFTFNVGYPSYTFQFENQLLGDGSGQPIPLAGKAVLRIVFHPGRAHTLDGTASTIGSQPPATLGLSRMVAYAKAGDFEGYLTYGIGMTWPTTNTNPRFQVRVYEVTSVNAHGGYRYVVAFDIDAR